MNQPQLKRNLSLTLVTFYGVGTILGAGIYVLVGHVAGAAGQFAPFAFITASLVAGFSAFSYAELVSRYPKSAGEAVYVEHAFGWRYLSITIGLAIAFIGLISTAVLVQGFYAYLNDFITVPKVPTLIISSLLIGAIVMWGIGQSVILAALITVIEVLGLLIIIWVARDGFGILLEQPSDFVPNLSWVHWQGIFLGGFIAFYAFIGFEDMVNVAEEVRDPTRNVPRAIVLALITTTSLYFIVAAVVVAVMPIEQLAGNDAPLAEVYRHKTGQSASVINIISLLSLLNGALVQLIMASRILYGMSRQAWLPTWFGEVNATTHTPINATLVITLLVIISVLALPLLGLAKLTSLVTLLVFSLINLALWRLKLTHRHVDVAFRVPVAVPVIGLLFSLLMLALQVSNWMT